MSGPAAVELRPRARWRKVYDTVAAYLRIDIIEDRTFPASTALRYVAVVVPVFMYYFQSNFLNAQAQYTSTLVGVSVAMGLQDALTGFTARLQFAQERGYLETYLVEPVPWQFIPLAMNVWRSITGVAITCMMLTLGCLLGAKINVAALPAFMVVLILGIVACNALGVLAASFVVLFKRGEPVLVLYGLAASLLGGSLFSIDVLPAWMRWASYIVPHAYVISASRSLLVSPAPTGGMSLGVACLGLVIFGIVVLPLSLRLFLRSLEFGRTAGMLAN